MHNVIILALITLIIVLIIKSHFDKKTEIIVPSLNVPKVNKKKRVKFHKSIIKKHEQKMQNTNIVFLDIGINNEFIGKITIQLYDDIVPKTCNNFKELCKTSYTGSIFHRIIKDFMVQGGDVNNGMSIYGEKFNDENFEILHDKPYLLSMANSGKNTNGTQFFITTNETPHLDGKHVVFGEVIDGFDVVDKMNIVLTDDNDKPIYKIHVLKSGIVQ